MWKVALLLFSLLPLASPSRAADLTDTEKRWLKGFWPVVEFAKASGLPLDLVVQPQPTPGMPPLSLAFVERRCKLVLSMRGNPDAQATLDRIDPTLLDSTLELMAAHELGHCRRYLDGAWFTVPAGFTLPEPPAGVQPELKEALAQMRAARREEGFADLVGLAWTQQKHPELYDTLHAWLLAERTKDMAPGSAHDTTVWLKLADDGAVLGRGSMFAGPADCWRRGLEAVSPLQ